MKRIIDNDYVTSLGNTFLLRLPENPTTGYIWNLDVSSGLQILSDIYEPPTTNGRVGSGGIHIWRFKAINLGLQTIRGVYKRPWENITGSEQTYSMNIMVIQ
jgi:inhibitor of cysteine peptidase